jgi:tRNA (guanine37-N1)-methyltransferase
MILKIEPLDRLLGQLTERAGPGHILIFLTPQGKPYTQPEAAELAAGRHLILLCGHYKGIDERVRIKYRPREISIGDYVLSGGEIPALVVIDSVVRLLPGAVGDEDSVRTDSFQQGLLDCPHYTRPPEYQGMAVPEVLVSGHHGRIAAWRRQQSQERTARVRPDLAGGGGEKPPGTGSDPKGT